jgi:hypothetical protein
VHDIALVFLEVFGTGMDCGISQRRQIERRYGRMKTWTLSDGVSALEKKANVNLNTIGER